MLHMLGQRALARSLFPVGELPKAETRALAERFGLPVATKPDSQELCFAPSGDAGAYARENLPHLVREGDVIDPAGTVLGRHEGAFSFTIGQRRGTGVATGERRYVVDVDATANRVVLGAGRAARPPRARRGPLLVDRGRAARRRAVRGRGPDPVSGRRRAVRRGAARRRRGPDRVPLAAASRGAGPERRPVPGGRGARRRTDRRGDPLTEDHHVEEHPNGTLATGSLRVVRGRRRRRRWRTAFDDDVTWHAPGNEPIQRPVPRTGGGDANGSPRCGRPASRRASTCTTSSRTTSMRSRSCTFTSRLPTGVATTSRRSQVAACPGRPDRRVLDDEPGPSGARSPDRRLTGPPRAVPPLDYHRPALARRQRGRKETGEAPPPQTHELRDPGAGHRPADHGRRRLRRGVEGRGPFVLGAAPVVRAPAPGVPYQQAATGPAGGRGPRDRPGDGRLGLGRRRRADVHVPRRGGRSGRSLPPPVAQRGHRRLRRRLLHQGEEAREARGQAARRGADHRRAGARSATGSASPRRSAAAAAAAVPTGSP